MNTVSASENEASTPSYVLDLVRQALPMDDRTRSLEAGDRLSDLGVTSLKLLTLLLDLEERFRLPETAFHRLTARSTLGTVVQLCLETESSNEDVSRRS